MLAHIYLGTPNKKKLPRFDKSLMILEFSHQAMLSSKRMAFFSMFGSNHKKVFEKLIGRRPWLRPFWRTETLLKIADASLKIYKRFSENVDVIVELNQSCIFLSWKREAKKETNLPGSFLPFFRVKCFLFFKSIYRWLLQHNMSTAKYCIPYLDVLD